MKELIEKIESYGFVDSHGHPLTNCVDWQNLKNFDVLKGVERTLGYCGVWNDTDVIECRKKDGRSVSMRVDVLTKILNA